MPIPTPVPVTAVRPVAVILQAILARLAALNPTDATLIALLAEFQTAVGQPLS